jgi:hypothetical protein
VSLFLAPADPDGHPAAEGRLYPKIVQIDDAHSVVWIWVPQLHDSEDEKKQLATFQVWSELPDAPPGKFAFINPLFGYRGLLRLEVKEQTLAAQGGGLILSNESTVEWPNDGATLKDILDKLDLKAPTLAPLLRTIAVFCSVHDEEVTLHGSLEAWLLSTPASRPNRKLATPVAFAEYMRSRPQLFDELMGILSQRRMIHLLAGHFSYLDEFLEGFESHLREKHVDRWVYVTAQFEHDAFREIYDNLALFPLRTLNAVFATLAFGAAKGLKQSAERFIQDLFEPDMDAHPLEFVKIYVRATKATDHKTHWDCISAFLSFLADAASKADCSGKVTIFLPFHRIEDLINSRSDDMRYHLWQGLSALQRELGKEPQACPQLGVLLAAHSLPLHKAETRFISHSVLQIPPLTRSEVDSLISAYVGRQLPKEAFDLFDANVGGDPWFVFQVLRCLSTLMPTIRDTAPPQELTDAIRRACAMVKAAIGPEEQEVMSHSAAAAGAMGQTGAFQGPSIPDDVMESVDTYTERVTDILLHNRGALGSQPVLRGWAQPVGSFGRGSPWFSEIDQTWLATGLIYVEAQGDQRGVSLNSFRSYPTYQFSQAGMLPRRLAEVAQERARGSRREAS